MELKPRKQTWRPQRLKGGTLRDIQKHLRENPGLTSVKVPPAIMAALLREYYGNGMLSQMRSSPNSLMISGVKIEVGK